MRWYVKMLISNQYLSNMPLKKAVIDAQTGTFLIEQTQIKLQTYKKSKRVHVFERNARVLPSPPSKRLAPVKIGFAYLIYAFC
jgi:hypothetical protein